MEPHAPDREMPLQAALSWLVGAFATALAVLVVTILIHGLAGTPHSPGIMHDFGFPVPAF